MTCEEITEERCFEVIPLEATTQTIEKCNTSLAYPKCNEVCLNLPSQICARELKCYNTGYIQLGRPLLGAVVW